MTRAELERAAELVHRFLPPTPQIRWPQLCQRYRAEVWMKHENHQPVGAFKVRGGLVYFADHAAAVGAGVIAATRGNHGQSVAFAARLHGVRCVIVVPHGNSREKNAAMRALGAELVEHGGDFQEALEHARTLARDQGLHLVPSVADALIAGVASAYLELFAGAPPIDVLYVPIGMGSGACAAIEARDALGLSTSIVGVIAAAAPAQADSFAAGRVISRPVAKTIADGVACRTPVAEALAVMVRGLDRIVALGESEIEEAMRTCFTDTHNVAEGAGAASLAAFAREAPELAGRRAAVVLTGGNVDRTVFGSVLVDPDSGSGVPPLRPKMT